MNFVYSKGLKVLKHFVDLKDNGVEFFMKSGVKNFLK